MRKIRDILRLRFAADLSIRQIKKSTRVSIGAIQKLLIKANELDLSWPLPDELDDSQLAQLFYPTADTRTSTRFQIPDWSVVHQELKRKGMTKQLLWEEYTQQYPNRCYSYPQFCDRYRHWNGQQKRSMRQIHKAGEKCFVDYCGPTVPIINASTGEIRDAQVFVGVLGASNYTYAEATLTQSLPDWLGSHVRMFEFFGGCSELVIPDNLRSGVSKACRYDPDLNASYQQLAEHYQLAEVNQCIHALLDDLNQKPFKQLPGNRLQAFEQLDKPALKSLPAHPYRYVEIKPVKVNIDYHVQHQQHHYSVPHQYVGETLELHASDTLVTFYFQQRPVASHPRKHRPGTTTEATHMPKRHQKHQQWTPGRLKNWAKDVGPAALAWVDTQLTSKAHPEQAYRVCLGLLNLSRDYPIERLNAACKIANREGLNRLKQVKSILQSNRDKLPEQLDLQVELPQDHENIRGPKNFH